MAVWSQMLGDAGAAAWRPPILQTHGSELGCCVRSCVCVGRDRGRKKKGNQGKAEEELPQGPLGNYRQAMQPHQLFRSSTLVKFKSCVIMYPD